MEMTLSGNGFHFRPTIFLINLTTNALGTVAVVLAVSGSLKAIQTAAIVTAFPLMYLRLLVV